MSIRSLSRAASALVLSLFLAACSAAALEDRAVTPSDDIRVDQAEIVHGVPDRGRNPAVVAIGIADQGLCTGALIAPNVVLTARHCVSKTSEQVRCPADEPQVLGDRAASSLLVLVGDDVTHAVPVARGRELVVPDVDALCDDDIALIVLDRPVVGIDPLDVRLHGVAKGDHVRAIGFGKKGNHVAAGTKVLREHVRVTEATATEFMVGEATCQGDSGGPALDEASGDVVGVVSRGGPSCDGADAHNIYTRTDAFLDLIKDALNRGALAATHQSASAAQDAGVTGKPPKNPGSGKTSDMGGACQSAIDCSAGVCVEDHGKQYCSRTCDTHDRCPAHYHCTHLTSGPSICTEH
jgi:hypothetical protein